MTVTVTKASLLLDSANDAVEQARVRYRKNMVNQHPLLSTLGDREVTRLIDMSSWISANAGDLIAEQGSSVEDVVFITEGNAREEVRDPERGDYRAVTNFLSVGDEIGLLSLLDHAPHHSSAIAMGRTQGLRAPVLLMQEMLQTHPEWYQSIAQRAVARFRATNLWLQALI